MNPLLFTCQNSPLGVSTTVGAVPVYIKVHSIMYSTLTYTHNHRDTGKNCRGANALISEISKNKEDFNLAEVI